MFDVLEQLGRRFWDANQLATVRKLFQEFHDLESQLRPDPDEVLAFQAKIVENIKKLRPDPGSSAAPERTKGFSEISKEALEGMLEDLLYKFLLQAAKLRGEKALQKSLLGSEKRVAGKVDVTP